MKKRNQEKKMFQKRRMRRQKRRGRGNARDYQMENWIKKKTKKSSLNMFFRNDWTRHGA